MSADKLIDRLDKVKQTGPGRWVPRDVLKSVAQEAVIVLIAGERLYRDRVLTKSDLDRVALAAGRLREAAREVGCHV